jgi:hypothetical protein
LKGEEMDMTAEGYPKVIAVDFDGVIHPYKGWKGEESFEAPHPGTLGPMRNELFLLRESYGWKVVVWTSREDEKAVGEWLDKNQIPYDSINDNPWCAPNLRSARKISADVYVDDKGMRFDGDWLGFARRAEQAYKNEWWRGDEEKRPASPDPSPAPPAPEAEPVPVVPKQRPTLGLSLFGMDCDQLAFFVQDSAGAVEQYKSMGYKEWITDEVLAMIRLGNSPKRFDRMETFKVRLNFNYQIMPCEFEILELLEGDTPQLPKGVMSGLSHLGFHVEDIPKAVVELEERGYELMAYIETLSHSSAPNRYCYAYVDTRTLGFVTKLIKKRD